MYRGRFAPSPTGPLHLGSLLTALGSYLDARSRGGQWLLRIEDIDPPREQPGATQLIIDALLAHGLRWDGDVLFQSSRASAYDAAIEQLLVAGNAYYCTCSRTELESRSGEHAPSCTRSLLEPEQPAAIRLRREAHTARIEDSLLGALELPPAPGIADPVIRRKDGLYSYQLAVVVDDAAQHITHIIRGRDLLDSTAGQLHLQDLLGYARPRYGHLPLLVNGKGQKLSKQNHADALDNGSAIDNLRLCLRALRQQPWPGAEDCAELLDLAVHHWEPAAVPRENQSCEPP